MVAAAEQCGVSLKLFCQRYELHEFLAKGGEGSVYLAWDRMTSKRVALKLVGPCDSDRSDLHERVMREAHIGGRLGSENIVRVFDAGWDRDTRFSFLSMEWLAGSDLQNLVDRGGALDPSRVVEYLRQVATGLDQAHSWLDDNHQSIPIVHRDLKPANLFLTKRQDGVPLVKILDFGVAKVLERSSPTSVQLRGTPLYMASEQILGAPVTPATDIWALGLVAFFLLTGKSYWVNGQSGVGTLPRLLHEVARGATETPSLRARVIKLDVTLPRAFDPWFMRCVHPRAECRFTSAGQAITALAEALRDPIQSRPVRGHEPTASVGRLPRSRGTHRLFWYGLGTALGFSAVVGSALLWQRTESSPRPIRNSRGLPVVQTVSDGALRATSRQ